ncbi:MAG: phosphate ABC transporter ATP-binding protein PstB [Bdellovibrionota bacterium]
MKPIVLETKELSVFYGPKQAVKEVSLQFRKNEVAAVIGPSGCGKSTYLRSLNRMNEFIEGVRLEGEILFHGRNVASRKEDPALIRRKIGMVFQKPNPFPKSIYNNITWGPKLNSYKGNYDELVEDCLRKAALWDEVKDRLQESAFALAGGQQQRLCIARAIAMEPEIILMEEPCSALDPRSTARIEDLIAELRANYSIVIVTHNMQQAARVSDNTHFFYDGDLIESSETKKIFTNPKEKRTEDYITGRFG